MFDLTKCKIGDKLVNASGFIYELVGIEGGDYPYTLNGCNGTVTGTTRTKDGKFYTYVDSEYDIVGFAAKPKRVRISKVKPVNKLVGLIEWVSQQESPILIRNGLYFYGTFLRQGEQFEYGYTSKQPYEATVGLETGKPVTVQTLNNFKGAVTKLLKG
jgi:hypothetical protein